MEFVIFLLGIILLLNIAILCILFAVANAVVKLMAKSETQQEVEKGKNPIEENGLMEITKSIYAKEIF